jgi:hypothetical protein
MSKWARKLDLGPGRMTGKPEVIDSSAGLVPTNVLALSHLAKFRLTRQSGNSHKKADDVPFLGYSVAAIAIDVPAD